MFNTVTWIIGFAAALLAFLYSNYVDYSSDAKLSLLQLTVIVTVAGLVICRYAYYAIRESAEHIRENMDKADKVMSMIGGLENLVMPNNQIIPDHDSAL